MACPFAAIRGDAVGYLRITPRFFGGEFAAVFPRPGCLLFLDGYGQSMTVVRTLMLLKPVTIE